MNVEYLSMFGSSDKRNKHVVDYLAIKVDVTSQYTPYYTIIYHPINSEKSDIFASMLVDSIFARDNNLYICIY